MKTIVYNLKNSTWEDSLPDMHEQRISASSCALGSQLFVIGGVIGGLQELQINEDLDYIHSSTVEWLDTESYPL